MYGQVDFVPMMICIDFDETYTRDPVFWDRMIDSAIARGHSVICCTGRYETEGQEVIDALRGHVEKIIFAGRKPKRDVVQAAGYYVSVWIDDMPELIGGPIRMIGANHG